MGGKEGITSEYCIHLAQDPCQKNKQTIPPPMNGRVWTLKLSDLSLLWEVLEGMAGLPIGNTGRGLKAQ